MRFFQLFVIVVLSTQGVACTYPENARRALAIRQRLIEQDRKIHIAQRIASFQHEQAQGGQCQWLNASGPEDSGSSVCIYPENARRALAELMANNPYRH